MTVAPCLSIFGDCPLALCVRFKFRMKIGIMYSIESDDFSLFFFGGHYDFGIEMEILLATTLKKIKPKKSEIRKSFYFVLN